MIPDIRGLEITNFSAILVRGLESTGDLWIWGPSAQNMDTGTSVNNSTLLLIQYVNITEIVPF